MKRAARFAVLIAWGCGGDDDATGTGDASTSSASTSSATLSTSTTDASSIDGSGEVDSEAGSSIGSEAGSDSGSESGDGGSDDDIGEWDDAPGACPDGSTRVDLDSSAQLAAASRGEGEYADAAPGTCWFIHDGAYGDDQDPILYITHGGSADAPDVWVGESRDGVHIVGRASIAASHVVLTNMTFDLTGYVHDGSFNTVDVGEVEGVAIDHVTFTGDCMTGADGGHIETNNSQGVRVEACLIERYGRCGPDGHQDHGIYLASGGDITIVDNIIRGNASRGIQLYTQGGEYGTLDGILIERNRILENGHGDQEDGIVLNGTDTGTISDVTIRRNLFYDNYYSGIRFAGDALAAIVIEHNTFSGNGAGSSSEARSEINIDEATTAANAMITGNIFAVGNVLINDCYDAAAQGFTIADNVVSGDIGGGDASCVGDVLDEDPAFVDAAAGDFHTTNPAVSAYGAYAQ